MSVTDMLGRGRESFRRGAWADACSWLSAADRESPLEPEDLEKLSMAAYLMGDDPPRDASLARAHLAFLDRGEGECARDLLRRPVRAGWKTTRSYREQVKAAHTGPREARAIEGYRFDPERFRDLNVPTLLLPGGDSPDPFKSGIERLEAVLPAGRVVVLPGQKHIAMDTVPDLFTREVLDFLRST